MKKFLVISPHPDDLDFGCAGTIAKLTKQGNIVEELIVSDGSKGNHVVGFDGKKLAAIRKKEEEAAAKVLGVKKVHFLNEIDGEVENTKSLRRKIVKAVRRIKPDIILSFDPSSLQFESVYRSHRDHRMVAEASFDALYPALGNSSFFPELIQQGFPPHKAKEIWFFATPRPSKFVDISKTMDVKIRALRCHKSQIADMKAMESRIKERARKEAKKRRKMRYAEVFRVIALD